MYNRCTKMYNRCTVNVQKCTVARCLIDVAIDDAIFATKVTKKNVQNSTKIVHFLHHYWKLVQTRCHKGDDTKMRKRLVGNDWNSCKQYVITILITSLSMYRHNQL